MTIAIDFDGVLAKTDYPRIIEPMPDVCEAMTQLRADGHVLVINTCREGAELTHAINWLLREGIPFDIVNDNTPENIATYHNNSRKICADLYIDDRNLGGFPGWKKAMQIIGSPYEGCYP